MAAKQHPKDSAPCEFVVFYCDDAEAHVCTTCKEGDMPKLMSEERPGIAWNGPDLQGKCPMFEDHFHYIVKKEAI